MDKRLQCIYKLISLDGRGVVDVGTDHGYIPIQLCKDGYTGTVIASDINSGPLNAAIGNATAEGVDGRIEFIQCPGLRDCPKGKVGTIVIAGMGGDTITGILDQDYWCCAEEYNLILQPMTKSNILRYWLIHNEFEITGEHLVKDMGRIYQVLTARKGFSAPYTDAELYLGKQNPDNCELYATQLNEFKLRTEKAALGMEKGQDTASRRYTGVLLQSVHRLEETL